MFRAMTFLIIAVSAATSAALAGPTVDRAYADAVLDGLVNEGVLTQAQADRIRAEAEGAADDATDAPAKPKWYDTTKISGYGQVRYYFNPDRSDPDNEFGVRRARIKVESAPDDRTKVQLQLSLDRTKLSVRDAWLQYDLDDDGDYRLRAGRQKIPWGYEIPQSSSRRGPLERAAITAQAMGGSRDLGLVLYWTDPDDAELFSYAKKNEWGTGDYGTVAIGVYNGQNTDDETNDQKHISARYTKPFTVCDGNYAEAGVSYYGGSFYSAGAMRSFDEYIVGAHGFYAPHPLGVQAEYYTGRTEGDDVDGFYVTGLWRPSDDGLAFVRYDEYNGSLKGQGIGNVYDRDRWSFGYARQLNEKTEFTIEYDIQDTPTGDDDMFAIQIQTGY